MALSNLARVFIYKNWRSLHFNYKSLVAILSVCLGVIYFYLFYTKSSARIGEQSYDAKDFLTLKQNYFASNDVDHIYYSPKTERVDELMELVRQELEISPERYYAFENPIEMRNIMEQKCKGICFAIEFQQVPQDVSKALVYTINSNKLRLLPKNRYVNDKEVNGNKDDDEYIGTGFLTLQYTIDNKYFTLQRLNTNFDVQFQSMPSIELTHVSSSRLLEFGITFSILLNMILLSTFLVPLVEEKQDGLKEFLTLATPMSYLNGATFFLLRFCIYIGFTLIVFLIASQCNAFGLTPTPAFENSICLLFILYLISVMAYSYLLSVCFNSVFYAKIGGVILLIIPYVFHLTEGAIADMGFCLLSSKAFLEGLNTYQTFTNKHRNFLWSDLSTQIKDDSFSIISVYLVLIFQIALYTLLYNYLSFVFPGPGGLKRHYLFFLNPSSYKQRKRNEYTTSERGTDAITIMDLNKKFKKTGREIVIADNLNMTIKNKQITVLLGHNGAGKTTTLNMIMGLEPKDSGSIVVCSERDVTSYRHLIGFCPQHSIFMSYMTCKEHLVFFARLRGMSKKESEKKAQDLLQILKLSEKEDEYGKNLSGGMKRRLSLGIALAGETKVVILDEPSSGLDVESRRQLWDILLKLRKSKAVLVTTHYMEEAEVLGDTINILSNGRLQCSGTPLQLKRGCEGGAYKLKLLTKGVNYKQTETLELIQLYIPSAKILNFVFPTVYISLPYEEKAQYHEMLLQLENRLDGLGIISISITDTSLEDVFLNCAARVDQVDSPGTSQVDQVRVNIPYKPLSDTRQPTKLQQFFAIAYKKLWFIRNEWLYTLIMLSLPFFLVSFAIFCMHSASVVTNDNVLKLKLNHFREGLIYVYNPTQQNMEIENLLVDEIKNHGIVAERLELSGNNTVDTELKKLQMADVSGFLQNVIGVVDMSKDYSVFKIFYSTNIYHSSVILLNLIDSTMLKSVNRHSDIITTYAPVSRYITDVSSARLEYFAAIVSTGMFFSIFYYLSLPFREHASGFKDLQPIPRDIFWMSTFICDIAIHFCLCFILYWFQRLIMTAELYNHYEQGIIISSIFFYGVAYLPILYCFGNSFRSISTITTYLLFMVIISAIVPHITSTSLEAMTEHSLTISLLSFLPDFNLNQQLRRVNENFVTKRRNPDRIELSIDDFFVKSIFVFVSAMALLIFVLENKYNRERLCDIFKCSLKKRISSSQSIQSNQTHELQEIQCSEEKQNVDNILDSNEVADYPLIVSVLQKKYDNQKTAVRDLSFAVKRGECFGLLGVNGAGKTTTFQIIGSVVTKTGGTIKIDGYDIHDQEMQYRYRFGYCPQYDSLNNFMTAKQSLTFMAKLRGIPGKELTNDVEYWLDKMDLKKYSNTQIRHYSGGTKRKLLAAMAMIGNPSLVLLDEPTTGVDPISRRFLWDSIQDFQKSNKTIVLTSHSLDECEQLCNRLAIMADGSFKCLGGICELKQRYGSGFTIKVKMQDNNDTVDNVKKITDELRRQFPEAHLREHHAALLTFIVPCTMEGVMRIEWSNVFKRTEQFLFDVNRSENDIIEDYSVNESTLEDIFLKFDTRRPSNTNGIQ